MTKEDVSTLEVRSQIADAKLGVAEELGWGAAILAGIAAHLKWEQWFLSLAIGVAVYFLAIYRYRKESNAAQDAYERASNTGKYYKG